MRSLPSWTSLEYLGLALYTAASRQHFAPLKDSSAMAEARSSITVCRLMSAPLDIFLLACLLACMRACVLACLLAAFLASFDFFIVAQALLSESLCCGARSRDAYDHRLNLSQC